MKISTAIITVVTAFASFTNAQDSKTTDTYDYVIVGGGVAGAYTTKLSNKNMKLITF